MPAKWKDSNVPNLYSPDELAYKIIEIKKLIKSEIRKEVKYRKRSGEFDLNHNREINMAIETMLVYEGKEYSPKLVADIHNRMFGKMSCRVRQRQLKGRQTTEGGSLVISI